MRLPRHSGFSLVEMTVVLAILGVLMAGGLNAVRVSQEAERTRNTQLAMASIKQALLGYAIQNGRLPCPARVERVASGLEAREQPSGRCAALQGYVPWATLGLGHHDGWGRPFGYRVSEIFAVPNTRKAEQPLLAPGMVFHLLTQGDLEIYPSDHSEDYLANTVAAVVVSHGGRGPGPLQQGGYGDEAINATDSKIFVSKPRVESPAAEAYDDVTDWISSPQLIAAALLAGRIP